MNNPLTKDSTEIQAVSSTHVPQNGEEILAETTAYRDTYPIWWEEIITPWSLAALLLLLGSNTLLSLAQGWQAQKPSESATPVVVLPPLTPLQEKKPLTFNQVSQIPLPSLPQAQPQPAKVVAAPPANLTQAILPPPTQPQWLPVHVPPPAPVVAQVPKPVASPLTPQPKPTVSPDLVRARILEETRLRELEPAPLGFNHRTRAKLQAAQTQANPAPLIEQMQQQQEKKVPSSLIIDSSGSQVNY